MQRIMRALVLMQCTNFGGMERATADQMRYLSDDGWDFNVISLRPWGSGRALFTALDPCAEASEYRGRFGWRTHSQFADAVRRRSVDTSVAWIVGTSLAAVRAATALRTPVVLSHHYHHLEHKHDRVRWRLFYEACRGVHAFIYPTEFTKDEALQIAPWLTDRAHVVPYSFESNYTSEQARVSEQRRAREALGIPLDAVVIGNAGWLIARKRFDVFLAAAAEISRRLPDARFEICGIGPLEEELRALASSLGVADRVVFRGLVADMEMHYRAWDACMFNSDFDTLPTTPLQAASFGCIVIASLRYGGLGEFLHDGYNGVLLAEHDIGRLSEGLVGAIRDDALAQSWRQAARDVLAERHAPDKCARVLASILKR